jgi:hypothetical protein
VRLDLQKVDPVQVRVEQREEPLLKKYRDSSKLRSSALHGRPVECFNNEVNVA